MSKSLSQHSEDSSPVGRGGGLKPPITDSPWLWFALFSAVGLVALVATGGKFGKRQATIERKGQARAALMDGLEVQVDSRGRKSVADAPTYSQPGQTRVRLLPLAVTLGLVCLASLGMLARERWTSNIVIPILKHRGTEDAENG